MLMTMPAVRECTATECAYNHDGCHAFAITIGGKGATCGTFIPLTAKGGLGDVVAQVGACSRMDCRHNADLECTAEAVRVGSSASCLTFEPA